MDKIDLQQGQFITRNSIFAMALSHSLSIGDF